MTDTTCEWNTCGNCERILTRTEYRAIKTRPHAGVDWKLVERCIPCWRKVAKKVLADANMKANGKAGAVVNSAPEKTMQTLKQTGLPLEKKVAAKSRKRRKK